MLTTSASVVSDSKRLLGTAVSGVWAKCIPIFSTVLKGNSRFLGEPSMLSDGDLAGRLFFGGGTCGLHRSPHLRWKSRGTSKRRGWRDFDNFHDEMGKLESTEGVSVLSEMSALGYLHGLSCWKQEVTPNALFISHFKKLKP